MIRWKYVVIVGVIGLIVTSTAFVASRTILSNPSETATDNNLSYGPRAFAVFTLPYEGDIVVDGNVSFTISEYDHAMGIIKKYLESQPDPSGSDSDSESDDAAMPNYIIQSIRDIPGNDASDGANSTIVPSAQSAEIQDLHPFDIFDSHKMITVQSLDNVTDAIEFGNRYSSVTHILYDIEHWSRTPVEEQASPILSIGEASRKVHAGALKYGITPDAQFLLETYREVQWTEVDFLGMQLQRFSQNITEFSNHAETISTYAKAANPSLQIFVQLSFRFTDSEEMIRAIEVTRPWVDGYIVSYLPSSAACLPDCNPQALAQVLERIRNPSPN